MTGWRQHFVEETKIIKHTQDIVISIIKLFFMVKTPVDDTAYIYITEGYVDWI